MYSEDPRRSDLEPSMLGLADDPLSVRLDRARTELRHGRPLLLPPADGAGPWRLVAAVETLSPERLRGLLAVPSPGGDDGAPRVLLTSERLQALGWRAASTPRAATLPATVTLDLLHRIAAVAPSSPPGSAPSVPIDGHSARPADAGLLAAIRLCKRARLVPALLVVALDARRATAMREIGVQALQADDIASLDESAATPALRRVSDAHVPIVAHEHCTLVLFREIEGDAEHVAILVGPLEGLRAEGKPVPVRLHSSCLTGDLLGSLRCDCGDQLRRAIDHLAESGGVLLYLAQEGRGTGLANKLRAYRLQDAGLDTLEADRHLGFREDERDFRVAAAMLQALEIPQIRLLTNNPHKIAALRAAGIDVVDRMPLLAPVNPHNARYLQTKHERAGHLRADEQVDGEDDDRS